MALLEQQQQTGLHTHTRRHTLKNEETCGTCAERLSLMRGALAVSADGVV